MQISQHVKEKQHILADWKVAVGQAFIQATHDPLTGLPNRALFYDRLRIALSESIRRREILGILFVDLDNFKKVNDFLGHNVGDQLLVSVASRMTLAMRSEETLARIGGDEFALLIPHMKIPLEAKTVASRLLQALDPLLLLKNMSLMVTASIGISLFPFDGDGEETLLKLADEAMFRVKKRGGNGYEFFKTPFEKTDKPVHSTNHIRNLPKRVVLIVDDDPDFQFILQNRLNKEGYECIGVNNVEEALKNVRLGKPDLVILDLGLQEASGIAFLQNFSKTALNGKKIPPVLVVSSHSDPEIVEFATILGASLFLPKPVGSSEIISAVRTFIQ